MFWSKLQDDVLSGFFGPRMLVYVKFWTLRSTWYFAAISFENTFSTPNIHIRVKMSTKYSMDVNAQKHTLAHSLVHFDFYLTFDDYSRKELHMLKF